MQICKVQKQKQPEKQNQKSLPPASSKQLSKQTFAEVLNAFLRSLWNKIFQNQHFVGDSQNHDESEAFTNAWLLRGPLALELAARWPSRASCRSAEGEPSKSSTSNPSWLMVWNTFMITGHSREGDVFFGGSHGFWDNIPGNQSAIALEIPRCFSMHFG